MSSMEILKSPLNQGALMYPYSPWSGSTTWEYVAKQPLMAFVLMDEPLPKRSLPHDEIYRLWGEGTWYFWVYGKQVEWEDLSDKDRMKVRNTPAWMKKAKDFWEGLEYEDEAYYVIEALEAL